MKYFSRTVLIIGLLTVLQFVYADITDTYTEGDTLTATKMNNIKSAVNDNDTRIIDNDAQIIALEAENAAQDARLAAEESRNASQDPRISANEQAPRIPKVITATSFGSRMIAGCINYTNTVPVDQVNQPDCGSGFTWKRLSNNHVEVTFNAPFGLFEPSPVVKASANILAGIYVSIGNRIQPSSNPFPSFNGFVARVTDTVSGGDTVTEIAPFSFIAIGTDGISL